MNAIDYIKKAVELADGWDHSVDGTIYPPAGLLRCGDTPLHPHIDALAAQLVRQVDALDRYFVETMPGYTAVKRMGAFVTPPPDEHASYGPDRTMNTLRCIVASGVLESADKLERLQLTGGAGGHALFSGEIKYFREDNGFSQRVP